MSQRLRCGINLPVEQSEGDEHGVPIAGELMLSMPSVYRVGRSNHIRLRGPIPATVTLIEAQL